MTAAEHNKYLAIGFGIFSALFGITFLMLMLISLGVFVALGISFANETGDANQAGIGILGGVFAVVFYLVLALILVLPTATASRKLWKRRPGARVWGIVAAILVVWTFPVGTFLAIYGLWFLFSASSRELYATRSATLTSDLISP
jgi:threonine/homoserine/homoserine lactone efflux protein